MKTISRAMATMLGAVMFASPALAERATRAVTSAQTVTGPDGKASLVLSLPSPIVPGRVSLGGAWLRLPDLPLNLTRDLRIRVCVLRAPWTAGSDAQVHESLVGRLEVPAGASAPGLDVTNIVRGIASGAEFHGLLVTVPEGSGSGFDATDAPLILAAFQQAVLELSYRGIPPPPVRSP